MSLAGDHKSGNLDPILVQRLSDRLMKGLLAHNQAEWRGAKGAARVAVISL